MQIIGYALRVKEVAIVINGNGVKVLTKKMVVHCNCSEMFISIVAY